MQDGIYFNLSNDDYHAIPRLSASGIKKMLISPGDFWVSSWLNPNREEDEKDTVALRIGRAYHTARFEPHLLDQLFVSEMDKSAYGGMLTDTDIKEALEQMGLPKSRAGEKVDARALRLRENGYKGPIWHLDLENWEQARGDREAIPAKTWREIHTDMERIQACPEIANLMRGGASEVAVLWTDHNTGMRYKCKFDSLKSWLWSDLKTFDNRNGKELMQCISDAYRYNRNYIQCAFYWRATEEIRAGQLPIRGDHTDEQARIIMEITARDEPLECWFIWQQKQGVPNLVATKIEVFAHMHESHQVGTQELAGETVEHVAKKTRTHSKLHLKAQAEIDFAVNRFHDCMEVFGESEPWAPLQQVTTLGDIDFSEWWLDQ